MVKQITVKGQGGTFSAYIARPRASPASTVIVLQELFGVNADIRKHCDELAEQGFLTVAPDLFWRQEPGVDLTVTSEADWAHGLRLYGAYDRDAGATDVKDTVNAVRNLRECNGKVALLGYCLGALMVFLTASRNPGVGAALAGEPNASVCSYAGQGHAFSRLNGTRYNAAAADLANDRTSECLQQHPG